MSVSVVKMGSHHMIARRLFVLLLFLLPASIVSVAQSAVPADPATAMPKNPVALIGLAAQVNGLKSITTPWHLRATYQTFDDQGQPKEQGVYEEWWAGPKKDKRVFTSQGFQLTEYFTENGEFRVGEHGLPLAQFLVRERLVNPIPDSEATETVKLQRVDNPFPKTKLTCVEAAVPMKSEVSSPVGLFPVYCFEMNQPMLRFSGSYGMATANYERISKLNGHFVGADFTINDLGKPFVKVHLEQGSLLTAVNDADFAPPADAFPVPPPVKMDPKEFGKKVRAITARVLAGKRLSTPHPVPIYPAFAKQARIQGTVVLQVIIAEDGHIRQLRVVSAPDTILAYSSIVTVRGWTYEPYLLDGKPVEVDTQINVVYTLGG
jgi:TonB family protein